MRNSAFLICSTFLDASVVWIAMSGDAASIMTLCTFDGGSFIRGKTAFALSHAFAHFRENISDLRLTHRRHTGLKPL